MKESADSLFFYMAVAGFLLGVGLRSFLDFGLPAIAWLMMMSLVLTLVVRGGGDFSRKFVLWVVVFLFLFSFGALRMEWASWSETNPSIESKLNNEITFTGQISREPDVRENSTNLYVKSGNELILVSADSYSSYNYGDVVEVTGVIERPESFITDLGRTFNYPGYLLAQGVSYRVSFAQIKVANDDAGNVVIKNILLGKHLFMKQIESLVPEPQVGLAEGLLLGVKKAMGDELEQVFRKTGIIHIVVLSGYNVMLVVTFVMYILSFALGKRLSAVFGVVSIALFAIMVGLSATVLRASIMASLLLLVGLTGRVYMITRALLVAGVVMILINPYLLAFDTGFQLSFLATLALILVAPHIIERLKFVPTIVGVREFLTATLATQLFVMPLLLYQIGEFSVVAVIVNVLVLPMVPVAMFLTFITGMISFVSTTLAIPFAYVTYLSLSYILLVANYFANLPFASFIVPAFPFWLVIISYGVIIYLLYWLSKGDAREVANDDLEGWTIIEEIK